MVPLLFNTLVCRRSNFLQTLAFQSIHINSELFMSLILNHWLSITFPYPRVKVIHFDRSAHECTLLG